MSSRTTISHATACAVLCAALPVQDGRAPEWVKLLPAGTFRPVDGRPLAAGGWTLTDPQAVIAASLAAAAGNILPIDYDHSIDLAAPKGGRAPAGGWIVELAARGDGVWGRVDWTEAGAQAVAGKEYRFISPVFVHAQDGTVTRLLGAALVNRPALNVLPQLASHQGDTMGQIPKEILAALGLPETADQAAVLAAISRMKGGTDAAMCAAVGLAAGTAADQVALAAKQAVDGVKAIAAAAGLGETATPDQVVTAVKGLKAAATVDGERITSLCARLDALEKDQVAGKVDAAIAAGKFVPAQRENLLAIAAADPARLDAMIASQPVVLKPGTADPAVKPAADGTLSEAEKAICRAMGLTEDAYKATLAAQKGG